MLDNRLPALSSNVTRDSNPKPAVEAVPPVRGARPLTLFRKSWTVIADFWELAGGIGLDAPAFVATVSGPEIETRLQADIAFARRAPNNGFPSLLLQTPEGLHAIDLDYLDATPMRLQIEAALGGTAA